MREDFSCQISTGYKIWVTKLSGKEKSYGIYVAEENSNDYIRIGRLTNVELFRKVLGLEKNNGNNRNNQQNS